MNGKLTDIATGELLKKFGTGNHKPGSGSASALQGMISAQMLRTVIDLTNDPKRDPSYAKFMPELLRIKREIDQRIYVQLELLFEKDSQQFDKVIKLRDKRDKEKDIEKKRNLSQLEKSELAIATDIPLDIADLCLELGHFAAFVFDRGFKSARGDSSVALNTSISGVASSLSIVELNLALLQSNQASEKIWQRKVQIKLELETLTSIGAEKLGVLEAKSNEARNYQKAIADFKEGGLAETVHSNTELEQLVRRFQNTLWEHKERIWKGEKLDNILQVLRPDTVLKKFMDYTYEPVKSLGMYHQGNELFEVAGLIDKNKRLVQVSRVFSIETQDFTAAHELGHLILHKEVVMHRDRPLDGSTLLARSSQELQADKFAAYFLMPSKIVESIFTEIFQMPVFAINESTVLGIRGGSIAALRKRCQNTRGLARLIASADFYAGKSFNTLADIFKVSTEAMAIRLEELNLIKF